MQYYLKNLSGWLRPAFSCLLLLASGSAFAMAGEAEEKSVIIIQEEDDGPIPEVEVYDRMFPIWGKEAVALGHEIPKPFGLSVIYMDISQPLIIEDISFSGLNRDLPLLGPITGDQLHVDANVAHQDAKNITFRADMWLFPFLNVYAILGKTDGSSTARINSVAYDFQCSPADLACNVRQGIVDGLLGQVSDFDFNLNYDGGTYGAGATIAGGVGNWFASADMNYTYTDLNILDGKITTFVLSPRVGYRFKIGTAETRIWLGAMYQDVQQNFTGSLSNLGSLPPEVAHLFPDGKFHISQNLVDRWNGTVGGMIALEQNFEFLFEAGFGDRKSLMGSLGYRF